MNQRPKLRDALIVVGLLALVATVVVFAHRAPAAPLTTTLIDVRESIGRYDQDLNLQVSVGARMSFVRQRSPARWVQAEALASVIDARVQADPTMAHAVALTSIASAARAFASDGRAAVAAFDGPRTADVPAVASALTAGHRFEAALDTYPVRWVDRLAYEPLFWLVLVSALAIFTLVLAHAAAWMFGTADTWAQRDRRRMHARLFWSTFVTESFLVVLLVLVVATHSLNNGPAVAALSVLAAAVLALAVIAEQRSREIIGVLKSHDREPLHVAAPPATRPNWVPTQTTIRTHVLSTMPPLTTASIDGDVLLLSDGMQAELAESGTVRIVADAMPRQ